LPVQETKGPQYPVGQMLGCVAAELKNGAAAKNNKVEKNKIFAIFL